MTPPAPNGAVTANLGGTSGNVGGNAPAEAVTTDAQLVLLRPNVAPIVERGYEIKIGGDEVNLRPIDKIDQNYQAAGATIGQSVASINTGQGPALQYAVTLKDGGLEIKPLSAQAATYVENNRSAVIGGSVLEAYQGISNSVDKIRTIFIDLK